MNPVTSDPEKGGSTDPEELFNRILALAKQAKLFSRGEESKRMRRLFQVFEANTRNMNNYHPEPYDGFITLLLGNDDAPEGFNPDPTRGWGALARGGLLMLPTPGGHRTVLKDPNVKRLAKELRNLLP